MTRLNPKHRFRPWKVDRARWDELLPRQRDMWLDDDDALLCRWCDEALGPDDYGDVKDFNEFYVMGTEGDEIVCLRCVAEFRKTTEERG